MTGDELDRLLATMAPKVGPDSVDGARERLERLRQGSGRRVRSRRATVAGLSCAVVVGALAAGGTVAAAANGTAPAPVRQVLAASGVLRDDVAAPTGAVPVDGTAWSGTGLVVREVPGAAGGAGQVAVVGLPAGVVRVVILAADVVEVELTASTVADPRVFLGSVPAEAAGAVLIGLGADGREQVRVRLDEARQLTLDMDADATPSAPPP